MVPVLLAVKREVAASISAGRQTDVLQCVIYFYGRDKTTTGQTCGLIGGPVGGLSRRQHYFL